MSKEEAIESFGEKRKLSWDEFEKCLSSSQKIERSGHSYILENKYPLSILINNEWVFFKKCNI